MRKHDFTINGLVVSCQALPEEPLHSSFIMSKMALAAKIGGAKGIRANTPEDIQAIKAEVDLPIIAIYKVDYNNSQVYITPTLKEVDALIELSPEVIAMDATLHTRPHNTKLKDLLDRVHQAGILAMADIATFEEAENAFNLGFDCIGTTLFGYTEETKGHNVPNFDLLEMMLQNLDIPIIAEGNFSTPKLAAQALKLGAQAVVVGGAITRPQNITQSFSNEIYNL